MQFHNLLGLAAAAPIELNLFRQIRHVYKPLILSSHGQITHIYDGQVTKIDRGLALCDIAYVKDTLVQYYIDPEPIYYLISPYMSHDTKWDLSASLQFKTNLSQTYTGIELNDNATPGNSTHQRNCNKARWKTIDAYPILSVSGPNSSINVVNMEAGYQDLLWESYTEVTTSTLENYNEARKFEILTNSIPLTEQHKLFYKLAFAFPAEKLPLSEMVSEKKQGFNYILKHHFAGYHCTRSPAPSNRDRDCQALHHGVLNVNWYKLWTNIFPNRFTGSKSNYAFLQFPNSLGFHSTTAKLGQFEWDQGYYSSTDSILNTQPAYPGNSYPEAEPDPENYFDLIKMSDFHIELHFSRQKVDHLGNPATVQDKIDGTTHSVTPMFFTLRVPVSKLNFIDEVFSSESQQGDMNAYSELNKGFEGFEENVVKPYYQAGNLSFMERLSEKHPGLLSETEAYRVEDVALFAMEYCSADDYKREHQAGSSVIDQTILADFNPPEIGSSNSYDQLKAEHKEQGFRDIFSPVID